MNCPDLFLSKAARHSGFTLVEVLLALVIMAMIAMLSAQAFNTASSGSAATREAMDRIAAIDRTFVLIETDLRNAIPKVLTDSFGKPLPPLYVADSDDYWMTVMRGGLANPLFLPRTEEVRVGYRYIEESIWRDTWYNGRETDQEDARAQKILEGVTSMSVRVLPPQSNTGSVSISGGPWLQDWPQGQQQMDVLPSAIEVTLELEDMGEVTRLFSLLRGQGYPLDNVSGNPGDAAGGSAGGNNRTGSSGGANTSESN